MADIAVPFGDEVEAPVAPPVSLAVPEQPTIPLSPADMPEDMRQRELKKARLKLQAATDEVERLKPTLEKILTATGYNIREGAVGATKQAVGNVTRAWADLVMPEKPHEVGSAKWFISNALGPNPWNLINRIQGSDNPESVGNLFRTAGKDLAEEGTGVMKEADIITEQLGGGTPVSVAGFLGRTAGASAPALLAAPLGLPAAATAAGLQSFGNTVSDFQEKFRTIDPNLSEEDAFNKALLPAGIVGTVTGLLTRGFGGVEKLVENIAQRGLTQAGVKASIEGVLRSAALEMPEEFLDQLSNGLVEKAMVDPNKQFKDIISDAAIAGLTALPTSLGTSAAITGTAAATAKAVTTAAGVHERSRLRRVVADAERFRERLRIQQEEDNAKAKVPTTGEVPAEQGQPAQPAAEVQAQTGTAQRGGASVQVQAAPVTPTTEVVTGAVRQSTPPPLPSTKVAQFGGYQFNRPDMPTYQIPGVRPGIMRNVSAKTARELGYVVPENIPTFEEWDAGGRQTPSLPSRPEATPPPIPQQAGQEMLSAATPNVIETEGVPEVQRRFAGMDVQQIANNWLSDPSLAQKAANFPGGWTRFMWSLGAMAKTPEDVAALRKLAEDTRTKFKQMMASGDMDGAIFLAGTQPAEAFEFATGVKVDGSPKWETFEKAVPGYAPTVPDAQYAKVKQQSKMTEAIDWKPYTKIDNEGYVVLDEEKFIEAIKSGAISGYPALNAMLLHVLERSDLHPLKGIRLYDLTPNEIAAIIGTEAFHGRFTTKPADGNVAMIEIAMLGNDGKPLSQLHFLVTLTHELLHNSLTSKLNNAPIDLIADMNELFVFAKQQSEGTEWENHNAMTNVHEFFAEGLSHPRFQQWLTGLDYSTKATNLSPTRKTAMGRFLELLKELFNLPDWVETLSGQRVNIITVLDQMVSIGQQLETIQRDGGQMEAASPASSPPPIPPAGVPTLSEAQIAAGATAVGRIAEKVVAERESAGAQLDGLAYERKQYRDANSQLKRLTDMATARFMQQDIDPDEVAWPDATAGVTVDDEGNVSVDSTFTDALEFVGIQHNAENIRDLQAKVFIERSARRYNNLQRQIASVERALAYYKTLKVPKDEQQRVGKQLARLQNQATKLGKITYDMSVADRAAEMKSADDNKTERIAKQNALSLPPVEDFFGRQVGGWRDVQQKITVGINYLNTLLSKASTPEQQIAAQQELAKWINLPAEVKDAINGGRALTDEQKASVYSALAQVFEEFDLRQIQMKDMADARLPELSAKIREQLNKISDAKIESGMQEVLAADVLATLDGETGKSGTLTSQRRQLQLKKDIAAIKSFAMSIGNNIDTNAQLFEWLANPTKMRPVITPGTGVGVGQTTLNMILDEVKSNPEFGSAIITLINASNEKLSNVPVIGLKRIERLVKKGTEEAMLEAQVIANQMLEDSRSKALVADQQLRDLLRGLADMEIEQRTLQEGMAMFSELAADPDFRGVRDHISQSPYGLVEPMVPSNHVQTLFKSFGTEGTPSHPELVLNANQDPQFKAMWFQKVAQWMAKAQEHLDAYDGALAAHNADPVNNPSPQQLGFDLPKVRGLRDAVGRYVPGAFLELSLLSENKRWKVPWIARKLMKTFLFRQHDMVSKMVGGITGTDLRNRLADFVNHYLISQSIRDRFRDLPDKLHAALKAHPEFQMNVQLYREHWNEMAHWGRRFGSPLRAGFVLPRAGRVVTEEDMALIRRQREYSEQLRRRVTETAPTQGIRVNTGTRVLVRPGAFVGDEGMPRYLNRRADNFIEQIVAAYGEPAGLFSYNSQLGTGSTDPIVQFWNQRPDLLIQHVLDASRTDRAMRLDNRMQQAENALANSWSGSTPTITSIEDLVNQLLPHFNATPGMNAQEELVRLLSDELRQYRDAAKGIINERNLQDQARHSQPEIAFSADNEFTRPAAKLELPSALYDYGALSSSEHLVLSSRANHERIVAYANALNRAIAELRSRMNELGKTMTEKEVAEKYGGNLKEMSDVLELLEKVQQDFKDAYDSASFLRAPSGRINDTLGMLTSAVLALPTVGIRNMTAGQFEVYMMSRAMGNAGHWMTMFRVIKNLSKTIVNVALQIGEGLVKGTNVGLALLTGKNRHLFEAAVRSMADALTGGSYGKNAARIADLGMDSRESFMLRLKRIWQETSEFSNMEDALSTWTVGGKRAESTAAVPFKVIKALFDKIGVRQFDFAINSTALTYSEWLVRRMKEVALAYGQARQGLGPFNPNDPAWQLKPHEWGKFASEAENENALANFRLFLEQSIGPEGFQLERSMWNFYQEFQKNPQAQFLTDRQMEALQRKLLADFNASTPANRPSAGPANPTVRNLLLLQGYVSDGVLKILNTTFGGVRDQSTFAKVAMKLPLIMMLALTSIILGLMQGAAVGSWEKWMRGRMSSLPTPVDKDFYTNFKRFAEGTIGLAASNFMYLGDLLLWLRGEIVGNRGFDPHMRIFGLSVLIRALNAARGALNTAKGAEGVSMNSLIPISDAVKSMTPFWLEVQNFVGDGQGELKQGERIQRGEYAIQGLLEGKTGFQPPTYGPTTISRRILSDAVSLWARNKDTNPAAAEEALTEAKTQVQKLEDFHYRQYLEKGYTEEEARTRAKRDTWNDYQEINPAVAALMGRRPTTAQHEAMMKALGGDRLAMAQKAEKFWKDGARALFNREGFVTREEGEAARSSTGGGRGFNVPGMPSMRLPGMPRPLRRAEAGRVESEPVRRVRRAVRRAANQPLERVRAGRRLVRRAARRVTRRTRRQTPPSLARRNRQRSVVRRSKFVPYSFA